MIPELFEWIGSIFENNDPTEAETPSAEDGMDQEQIDGVDGIDGGIIGEAADSYTAGDDSTNDMLNNGITTSSVSPGTEAEKHDQTPFVGHTSYGCTLCGCKRFVPKPDDPSICICGHHDQKHEWK